MMSAPFSLAFALTDGTSAHVFLQQEPHYYIRITALEIDPSLPYLTNVLLLQQRRAASAPTSALIPLSGVQWLPGSVYRHRVAFLQNGTFSILRLALSLAEP
jgi:hypothetical protein